VPGGGGEGERRVVHARPSEGSEDEESGKKEEAGLHVVRLEETSGVMVTSSAAGLEGKDHESWLLVRERDGR
jgi:hypothetical protein